jgi:hypothetical protein
MANTYKTNPIVLDTFSAAVDLNSQMGGVTGTPLKLNSIEWTGATTNDTCLITDKASGNTIFSETCYTTNVPIIKYYYGARVPNLYIAISGSTGKLIITLV